MYKISIKNCVHISWIQVTFTLWWARFFLLPNLHFASLFFGHETVKNQQTNLKKKKWLIHHSFCIDIKSLQLKISIHFCWSIRNVSLCLAMKVFSFFVYKKMVHRLKTNCTRLGSLYIQLVRVFGHETSSSN